MSDQKKLIKEMCSTIGVNKYMYDNHSTVSDVDNQMWGKFAMDGHKVKIHVAAHAYSNELKGKVWMTVRANCDDSRALSKHIFSDNVDELIATFNEYKALAESVPETTDWQWYIDHGFRYYQV